MKYEKMLCALRNTLGGLLICFAASFLLPVVSQADKASDTGEPIRKIATVNVDETANLGFQTAFSKPIYRKSYFPVVILGTGIVAAGAISYLTAGAGAPAAATGVSTIASVVGGGGQGAYMAGLSAIGGWFGGNAMLGAAILNGISLGTIGGSTSWTAMTAMQKAGVIASATATAVDGTLVFSPKGQELEFRVRLESPPGIGSTELKKFAEEISDATEEAYSAALEEDESALKKALERQERYAEATRLRAEEMLVGGANAEDLVLVAVLRKNSGDPEMFEALIQAVPDAAVADSAYLDYLRAVNAIENRDLHRAQTLLWKAWRANPYAIEPPILLVNILAHESFSDNEQLILFIAERAAELFDDDAYTTPYGLLAIHYRLATMYFSSGRYAQSLEFYEKAYDDLPLTRRWFQSNRVSRLIQLGIANSHHGVGNFETAQTLFETLLEKAESESEKEQLKAGYAVQAP